MGGFTDQAGLGMMNLTGLYQQWEESFGVGFWNSLFGSIGGLGVSSLGPDKDGWYTYFYSAPPKDALCQFKQDVEGYVGGPWVGYSSDFSPEFNVAYLKWRLTGIAKEGL